MKNKLVLDKHKIMKQVVIDVHVNSTKWYDFRFWFAKWLLLSGIWIGGFTLGELTIRLKDQE